MQEHIKMMTELFNELSVIGDKVSDEDRVVHLLASLPDSYNVLVTALEAAAEVPSMEVVIERLLHEERKLLNGKVAHSQDSEGAMLLKRSEFNGPKCYRCKEFGHIKRDCLKTIKRGPDSKKKHTSK